MHRLTCIILLSHRLAPTVADRGRPWGRVAAERLASVLVAAAIPPVPSAQSVLSVNGIDETAGTADDYAG